MDSSAPSSEGLSQVAGEILAYLASHGQARDSLEGILEWWILEREIVSGMAKVRLALRELVEKGLVEEENRTGVSRFRAIPPGR